MKAMDGLKGKVENVRASSSTWVQGGGIPNNPVASGTNHYCTFQIGKRTVRLVSAAPPVIEEGDHVAVVGKTQRDGIFYSRHYANLSRGIRQDAGSPDTALTWGVGLSILSAAISTASAVAASEVRLGVILFVACMAVLLPAYGYEVFARRRTAAALNQCADGPDSNV